MFARSVRNRELALCRFLRERFPGMIFAKQFCADTSLEKSNEIEASEPRKLSLDAGKEPITSKLTVDYTRFSFLRKLLEKPTDGKTGLESSCQGSINRTSRFDYLVVIDFEATCDLLGWLDPQEIIEFPSVLVNTKSLAVEDTFQTYLKPACHPILTEFCKDLTGIQQPQVDDGVSLAKALAMHDDWLEKKGVKNADFAIVTWSDWDCRDMLDSECNLKCLSKPTYFDRWINLKVPFRRHYGQRCDLMKAVARAGLTWQGRLHCGLDDAKNTASIALELLRKGVDLNITANLTLTRALHKAAKRT